MTQTSFLQKSIQRGLQESKTAVVLSLPDSPPGRPSANKHVLDGNWARCVSDRLIAGTWSSRLGSLGPGLGQAGEAEAEAVSGVPRVSCCA